MDHTEELSAAEMRPTWRLPMWKVFALWGVFTILSAAQGSLAQFAAGKPEPFHRSLMYAATIYMTWAALTPIVLRAAKSPYFSTRRPLAFVAMHALLAVFLGFVHAAVCAVIFWFIFPDFRGFLANPENFAQRSLQNLQVELLIYALLLYVIKTVEARHTLQTRELDTAELKAQLASAEVAALRAQLQPHFLFNTLNAISALVRKNPPHAERLIARLGDLLRLSIDERWTHTSTLADELKFTEAYLEIEQARLGDRLRVEKRIEPAAIDACLPSLTLQPLVENAVRHGVTPCTVGGTVSIVATLKDNALLVLIEDDGVGASHIEERVGLGGCRQRLQRQFGDTATMEVDTSSAGGFSVKLRIPQ